MSISKSLDFYKRIRISNSNKIEEKQRKMECPSQQKRRKKAENVTDIVQFWRKQHD